MAKVEVEFNRPGAALPDAGDDDDMDADTEGED